MENKIMFLILKKYDSDENKEVVVNTDNISYFQKQKDEEGNDFVRIKFIRGTYMHVSDNYECLKIILKASDTSMKVEE
jgi:hypothetical protein